MRWGDLADGKREAPEPLEGNPVRTVLVGTITWAVLFVVQLPFYGWFDDNDHLWWLWTCAAGAGLGLIGLWYVRARDAAIRRAEEAERQAAGRPEAGGAPGKPGTPEAGA
ncbi:DUF2530 domain-containing protein [Streptomyces sp. 3MP-14]|uniref:DUF2530 domain-containing protein n=1 Tax=Streptomyces mimosae TaxID=2586635 RepID=A0A5N6A8B6_9ACTN|nr:MULTISPECIES: DUF2530 domain-containing protein [Streptomyces]KAB8164179.1 DUF2530 domain-containing protein [Streptomyces mimosae]KAB8176456.1 DUF2530 domain-containing protein [Streptomyces sp. 3MP-14]